MIRTFHNQWLASDPWLPLPSPLHYQGNQTTRRRNKKQSTALSNHTEQLLQYKATEWGTDTVQILTNMFVFNLTSIITFTISSHTSKTLVSTFHIICILVKLDNRNEEVNLGSSLWKIQERIQAQNISLETTQRNKKSLVLQGNKPPKIPPRYSIILKYVIFFKSKPLIDNVRIQNVSSRNIL